MKTYHPPTILHLVLIGYFVVLLPLVAAIARGARSLDSMSQMHRDNIAEVVAMTQTTENLNQAILDLERVTRQYRVLGEPSLFEVLQNRLKESQETLNHLDSMAQSIPQISPVIQLMKTHIAALERASRDFNSVEGDQFDKELIRFETLNQNYQKVKRLLQENFSRRVEDAKESATETRTELLVLGLALFPGTFVLVAVFMTLIARPIRQLKGAIRRLGNGDYERRFELQGPRDLQEVAIQLNWLAKKLRAADSEKKRFLRHISHELKTPLSTLKEGTDLLREEIPGKLNVNQKEVVEILYQGVESFQILINNLLDYNLLRRDPEVHPNWYQLEEVVKEILQPHKLTAERKQIDLSFEGPEVSVFLDRSFLKAALDNLISNAIHYTPKIGQVKIRWKMDRNENIVKIEVQDTGPGIPVDEREKVFLPFYQGQARKEGPLKGTGLGLSIAKECAESLQGTLQILDSKVGTLFRLTIPVLLNKGARS